jgi:hypothetical protein
VRGLRRRLHGIEHVEQFERGTDERVRRRGPCVLHGGGRAAGRPDTRTDQYRGPRHARTASDAAAVEPPASIADDWSALTDGLDRFATAAAAVNPSDPASAAEFVQLRAQLLSQLAGPAGNVQTFLGQECGLSTGASPTS